MLLKLPQTLQSPDKILFDQEISIKMFANILLLKVGIFRHLWVCKNTSMNYNGIPIQPPHHTVQYDKYRTCHSEKFHQIRKKKNLFRRWDDQEYKRWGMILLDLFYEVRYPLEIFASVKWGDFISNCFGLNPFLIVVVP